MRTLTTISFVFFVLLFTNAMAAQNETHWVGTVQSRDHPAPIRFDFQESDSAFSGTVSAPSEELMLTPISNGQRNGERISFTARSGPDEYQFSGDISGNTLTGLMKSKEAGLPFSMVRLASVNNEKYFGVFKLGGKKNIYIRTWDELGPDQLTYFDDSGNVGALYAVSKESFFAGPSLMVPLPKQAEITFRFHSNNEVSGLTWKDASGAEKPAEKSAAIHEEAVAFQNGSIPLAGTLVLPQGEGSHPAVVLVHGSGPVTRDFFGPFAYVLASKGIAVLSYDKRGIGESGGDWLEADFEALAEDALAGIQYLKSRKEIRTANIGLLGISQGGWIIPLAASKSGDVAFAVLISTPAVSPVEQDEARVREEMQLSGSSEEEIQKKTASYKEQIDGLMSDEGLQWVQSEIQKAKDAGNTSLLASSGPDNPRFLLWLRSILRYDPLPALKKVKCPVLAVYGELDRGVPVKENKNILENTLKDGGNQHVQVVILPSADHALLECKTGSATEFPYLKRFVPGLFETVVQWIQKQAGERIDIDSSVTGR